MGARRIRREQRQVDMAESRHRNGILKGKTFKTTIQLTLIDFNQFFALKAEEAKQS